jgi:DNA-binding LytR/AlgR family response regulator
MNGNRLNTLTAKNSLMISNYAAPEKQKPEIADLPGNLSAGSPKTSFLVFKHNKYMIIPIENIAYFYVKYDSSLIVCFDKQEYFVNHSLEQIQRLVSPKHFFRLNRQYLINFRAVKEVEHYFARKLQVHLKVAVADKLLVPKEKTSAFLSWLDHR